MGLTAKEKAEWTYKILKRRKKLKEYKRRAIEVDVDSLRFKCMEKAARRMR
jgi:hypothetical protein